MLLLPLMLIWVRDPMSFNTASRWCFVALATIAGVISPIGGIAGDRRVDAAEPPAERSPATGLRPAPAEMPDTPRMREGSRIGPLTGKLYAVDETWWLRIEDSTGTSDTELDQGPGQHAPAVLDASQPLNIRLLENLALQRIVQAIRHDSTDQYWTVTGTVTEYFGENRLLLRVVTRAPKRNQ